MKNSTTNNSILKNSLLRSVLLASLLLIATAFTGTAPQASAAPGIYYNNGYFRAYRANWYYAYGYNGIQWIYYDGSVVATGSTNYSLRTTSHLYGYYLRANKSLLRSINYWAPGTRPY